MSHHICTSVTLDTYLTEAIALKILLYLDTIVLVRPPEAAANAMTSATRPTDA